jgi:hypothetical protein
MIKENGYLYLLEYEIMCIGRMQLAAGAGIEKINKEK